jgi:hypothetical protein
MPLVRAAANDSSPPNLPDAAEPPKVRFSMHWDSPIELSPPQVRPQNRRLSAIYWSQCNLMLEPTPGRMVKGGRTPSWPKLLAGPECWHEAVNRLEPIAASIASPLGWAMAGNKLFLGCVRRRWERTWGPTQNRGPQDRRQERPVHPEATYCESKKSSDAQYLLLLFGKMHAAPPFLGIAQVMCFA